MPSPPPALAWAHPLIAEWFGARLGAPTEPQQQGWPQIVAGRNTLISAPTGSGKTLAAFLVCIDRLARQAFAGALADRTTVLYISPLKALGNDIQKNLEAPLAEILQLARERGLLLNSQPPLPGVSAGENGAAIRTAVRTGDTPAHERRAMLRRPPHILVTTPESLYILLTAEKSRQLLRDVETVIVDEIHAVADDKRGAHLALSLERLQALAARPPVRIGLSATQKPLAEVARFLTGSGRPQPVIVDVGHRRRLDLAIEVPPLPLGPVASNDLWDEVYKRIAQLALEHRSTLIFVNTRRLAERVAHSLAAILGEGRVAAHHGSLSRKLRLEAERKLKAGEIRALVATASLELGIDIGYVDLVCHIGSPRSIAVTLQRIGRAGHWPHSGDDQRREGRSSIPKGRIFPTTRDELVECAALVRAIRAGELDRLEIPLAPLDILAQQLVATVAGESAGDEPWSEEQLFALARRAYPYRELERAEFDAVLEMLSEGIAARRGRYGAYLHRDRVNRRVRPRRGARLAAITSGGAIPENALFTVVAQPEGTPVGTLEEDFAIESMKGDIILLGNSSWRIQRVDPAGRVLVEDAHGAAPNIPFWLGEAPARTPELSREISRLRKKISELARGVSAVALSPQSPAVASAVEWLQAECGVDESGAGQLVEYIVTGRAVLGEVPAEDCVIAERFFDEGGGMQLVLHAPFGARINKAWGLALRKRFCVSFNFELQAAATDNGLNLSLAEQHSFPLADVFNFLQPETVAPVLQQAALLSPIFATRWRWDATRALALLRFQGGKKVPPQIQRIRSDDLLASVFPQVAACQENVHGPIQPPDHPLVREVMKDVLTEALDLEGLKRVLERVQSGAIRCLAVDTPVPSVFSHEILNANPYAFLDDAPLEERRARAVELRRVLPEAVLEEVGRLDPAAIAQVRAQAWPDVRDAEELADALHTLVALPADFVPAAFAAAASAPPAFAGPAPACGERWAGWFAQLQSEGRALAQPVNGRQFWFAAERAPAFAAIFSPATTGDPGGGDHLLALATGWMQHLGPATAAQLASLLGLPPAAIEKALLQLEAAGALLRGNFTAAAPPSTATALPPSAAAGSVEFCERRLLARIHRLTLGGLRRQIQPVTPALFLEWLLRWQHLAPGSALASSERSLLELLRQLQGFEIPASAWEPEVLARRMRDYDPKLLDQLSLSGAVGWGRLSPHPALLEQSGGARRVVPTSVAPITFFVRDDAGWMLAQPHPPAGEQGLSPAAREVLKFLRAQGASFFADIVRASGLLKSEVETGLWELVAAGLITADGFDNLRALIDPRRRSGQRGAGPGARPRHSLGRWALLPRSPASPPAREELAFAACRMLLARYGVVFRDLLARETLLPAWRELLLAFRRLEARGEVRGGRFVDGFVGEQFALPLAVESLRALRHAPPATATVTVSAADPLNLAGIIVPGERVAAISGRFVSFRGGAVAEAPPQPLPAAL